MEQNLFDIKQHKNSVGEFFPATIHHLNMSLIGKDNNLPRAYERINFSLQSVTGEVKEILANNLSNPVASYNLALLTDDLPEKEKFLDLSIYSQLPQSQYPAFYPPAAYLKADILLSKENPSPAEKREGIDLLLRSAAVYFINGYNTYVHMPAVDRLLKIVTDESHCILNKDAFFVFHNAWQYGNCTKVQRVDIAEQIARIYHELKREQYSKMWHEAAKYERSQIEKPSEEQLIEKYQKAPVEQTYSFFLTLKGKGNERIKQFCLTRFASLNYIESHPALIKHYVDTKNWSSAIKCFNSYTQNIGNFPAAIFNQTFSEFVELGKSIQQLDKNEELFNVLYSYYLESSKIFDNGNEVTLNLKNTFRNKVFQELVEICTNRYSWQAETKNLINACAKEKIHDVLISTVDMIFKTPNICDQLMPESIEFLRIKLSAIRSSELLPKKNELLEKTAKHTIANKIAAPAPEPDLNYEVKVSEAEVLIEKSIATMEASAYKDHQACYTFLRFIDDHAAKMYNKDNCYDKATLALVDRGLRALQTAANFYKQRNFTLNHIFAGSGGDYNNFLNAVFSTYEGTKMFSAILLNNIENNAVLSDYKLVPETIKNCADYCQQMSDQQDTAFVRNYQLLLNCAIARLIEDYLGALSGETFQKGRIQLEKYVDQLSPDQKSDFYCRAGICGVNKCIKADYKKIPDQIINYLRLALENKKGIVALICLQEPLLEECAKDFDCADIVDSFKGRKCSAFAEFILKCKNFEKNKLVICKELPSLLQEMSNRAEDELHGGTMSDYEQLLALSQFYSARYSCINFSDIFFQHQSQQYTKTQNAVYLCNAISSYEDIYYQANRSTDDTKAKAILYQAYNKLSALQDIGSLISWELARFMTITAGKKLIKHSADVKNYLNLIEEHVKRAEAAERQNINEKRGMLSELSSVKAALTRLHLIEKLENKDYDGFWSFIEPLIEADKTDTELASTLYKLWCESENQREKAKKKLQLLASQDYKNPSACFYEAYILIQEENAGISTPNDKTAIAAVLNREWAQSYHRVLLMKAQAYLHGLYNFEKCEKKAVEILDSLLKDGITDALVWRSVAYIKDKKWSEAYDLLKKVAIDDDAKISLIHEKDAIKMDYIAGSWVSHLSVKPSERESQNNLFKDFNFQTILYQFLRNIYLYKGLAQPIEEALATFKCGDLPSWQAEHGLTLHCLLLLQQRMTQVFTLNKAAQTETEKSSKVATLLQDKAMEKVREVVVLKKQVANRIDYLKKSNDQLAQFYGNICQAHLHYLQARCQLEIEHILSNYKSMIEIVKKALESARSNDIKLDENCSYMCFIIEIITSFFASNGVRAQAIKFLLRSEYNQLLKLLKEHHATYLPKGFKLEI